MIRKGVWSIEFERGLVGLFTKCICKIVQDMYNSVYYYNNNN